jgi:hypothetical protein
MLFLAVLACSCAFAQKVSFKKSTLSIREPYDAKKMAIKTDTFDVVLQATEPDTVAITLFKISNDSKFTGGQYKLVSDSAFTLIKSHTVQIAVTTSLSDENGYLLLKADFRDTKGELRTSPDTLVIENSFPFKASAVTNYTDWNDGKSAEVFIGTNFDFFGDVSMTDWYGGARVFLPSITDLKYKRNGSSRDPRWGIAAGIYHSKSFSNFGNGTPDNFQNVFSRVDRLYSDTVNNVPRPVADVRYDTLKVNTKIELNNWGIYLNPIYQWSSYSGDNKFVTNLYVGGYMEVIRRNTSTTYTFDSAGSKVIKVPYSQANVLKPVPKPSKYTYYDAYFGVNMPIQFLWKDIMDLKINPTFGIGSPGIQYVSTTRTPWFYMFQFDLLARLGGIKVNLGGEVRGYFPNEAPVISAYIGTSFDIGKLAGLDKTK